MTLISNFQLGEIAAEAPPPAAAQPRVNGAVNGAAHTDAGNWVESWCAKYSIDILQVEPHNGGRKYTLAACPFNPEHRDSAIFQGPNGKLGFKCFHVSCAGKGWKQLRESREGPAAGGAAGAPADNHKKPLEVTSMTDILTSNKTAPALLIEQLLPEAGATVLVGMQKSGKSVLAWQMAIAVARGEPLFDNYRVLRPGPVLIVEQDDPNGMVRFKEILVAAQVPADTPIYFVAKQDQYYLGPGFCDLLREKILDLGLVLIILDSYSALRPAHAGGGDIVKIEHSEITELDEVGKEMRCSIVMLHHDSHAGGIRSYFARGAGTYGLTMASEAQFYIERFRDLPLNAPERLVLLQGHGLDSCEMLLRFDKRVLGYQHVLEGPGAMRWPLILDIQSHFGPLPFTVKNYQEVTGQTKPTAYRHLAQLFRDGVLEKTAGSYQLIRSLQSAG